MQNLGHVVQRGATLIEIMVTVAILAVGLLGLAGLQARAFNAEAESYSRAQALILANDMADRIATNRAEVKTGTSYASATVFGVPYTPLTPCAALPMSNSAEVAAKDLCEWSEAIKGASEMSGTNKIGQINGGRGCLSVLPATSGPPAQPQRVMVTIAWAGRGAGGTVASNLNCGQGAILPESARRAISVIVPFADLDA